MDQWQSGGNSSPPAGHIYVNGYGFVSEDPWLQENRNIWKCASLIGVILLGILLIPSLLSYSVQILLNLLFAPFVYLANGTYILAELQVTYYQCQELLLYLASMLLPLVFAMITLRPKLRKRQGIYRSPSPHILANGTAICMAIWVIFYLGGQLLSQWLVHIRILPLSPDSSIPSGFFAVCVYVLRVVLLPALLEELLFRGYILRALRQFGDSFAIIASSVAFGMVHYTVTKDIRNFVLGMVLAYFVIRSGSVWTAVIGRGSCLIVGLAVDCLPHVFPGSMAELMQNILFLAILTIGLLSFIQLGRTEGNPFVLSSGHTATRISHKLARFFGNIVLILAIVLWAIQAAGYLQFIG